MFTGVIRSLGTIEAAQPENDGAHVVIVCDFQPNFMVIGESIAVDGACLTVVDKGKRPEKKAYFAADLSAETLSRTAPRWQVGTRVNLERALIAGDPFNGHMVSGHIDGLATLKDITPAGDSQILTVEAPAALSHLIAEKGSVTLDGISLTVNKVEGNVFQVNIIPHTWQATTLSDRKPGDALNLEVDMMARYVARLMEKDAS